MGYRRICHASLVHDDNDSNNNTNNINNNNNNNNNNDRDYKNDYLFSFTVFDQLRFASAKIINKGR